VVDVPPSHSPVLAATIITTPSCAPWKLVDELDFFEARTPMNTVRAKYARMIMI